jgi:hypothetical protein
MTESFSATQWAQEHGKPFRWQTQLDNHTYSRNFANGNGWEYDIADKDLRGVILDDVADLRDPHKAMYLLDDGQNVRTFYVAGWNADKQLTYLMIHPFPLSVGTRPDNGLPIDMSTWQLGPRRAYHLKVTWND